MTSSGTVMILRLFIFQGNVSLTSVIDTRPKINQYGFADRLDLFWIYSVDALRCVVNWKVMDKTWTTLMDYSKMDYPLGLGFG